MKLGVKGYQAIEKAAIDAQPGQIVGITGSNNEGKSAFVRAIQAFILNSPSKEVINDQVGNIRVLLKDDEGLFEWRKTTTKTVYLKNKKERSKISRQPINEVFPECGFPVEKEGSDLFIPFIVPEGTVPFPFNVTPSIAFKIFSKFVSTSKMAGILKELKTTIKEDNDSLKKTRTSVDIYQAEKSQNERKLEAMPSEETLSKLKDLIKRVQKGRIKVAQFKRLQEIKSNIDRWTEELNKYDREGMNALKVALDSLKEGRKLVTYLKEKRDRYLALDSYIKEKWIPLLDLNAFVENNKARVAKIGDTRAKITTIRQLQLSLQGLSGSLAAMELNLATNEAARAEFKSCPLCKRPF